MPDFSNLIVKLLGNTSDFDKNFKNSQRLLDGFASAATSAGARLSAAFTVPMVGLGVASLKAAGQMEQTNIAFKTMLGSADAAQKHLADLKAFALSTPFEFTDVVAASRKMQALGFSIKELIPTLRIVGDAAAGLGLGAEGIQRITLALGQMKAKGAVQAEEMRQLAEVGIPAWQILAKTLNTDVAGAMKLVEKRAVDSATAVPAILAGINAKFGGLMEAQSQTLLGKWSNFQDKMQFTLIEIGNTLKPEAEKAIALMTQMGDSALQAAKGFEKLPEPIKNVGLAIGGLAIAAAPSLFVMGQLIASLKEVRSILPMVGTAITSVGGYFAVAAGGVLVLANELRKLNKEQDFVGPRAPIRDPLTGGTTSFDSPAGPRAGASGLLMEQNRAARIAAEQHAEGIKAIGAAMDAFKPKGEEGLKLAQKLEESYKANAKAQTGAATASAGYTEKVRLATLAELVQVEIHNRGKAAIGTLVNELVRFNGYLDGNVLSLQAASTASLDLASAQYQTKLMFDQVQTPINMASVAMDAYKGTILETDAILRQFGKTGPIALLSTETATRAALERMIELYNAGKATAAQVQAIGQVYAESVSKRKNGGELPDKPNTATAKAQKSLLQVSTIITDLSRGFTDVIFKSKTLGEAMTNVGKTFAQGLVRTFIEGGINKTVGALGKFVGSLGGFGKTIGGLLGGIGGNVAGSAVGGAVGSGVGSAVGSGVGSAAGSAAGGAASGAVGAAASSITGMVSAVASVGSLVSGIISNFQMAAIGKDTGRMEEQLRGILNVIANNGSESIHHFAKQSMFANIGTRDYVWGVGHSLLIGISSGIDALVARSSAGSGLAAAGGNITINIQGGVFSGDAMAMDSFAEDMARRIREKLGVR